ncbi:hypothetical protein CEXT_36991 [Caerostris extrusa]|uniref:Uncharacterized protein n=1 Tax=Caerostris extrusa TaxID=172846 RepID=A0AAV4UMK4_CAEEX|nr:hypothetical protein CEXT_36991 [Caerostris extrusa]
MPLRLLLSNIKFPGTFITADRTDNRKGSTTLTTGKMPIRRKFRHLNMIMLPSIFPQWKENGCLMAEPCRFCKGPTSQGNG